MFYSIALMLNLALLQRYIVDTLLLFNIFLGVFPFLCSDTFDQIEMILAVIDLMLPLILVSFTMFYLSFMIMSTSELDDNDGMEEMFQSILIATHRSTV